MKKFTVMIVGVSFFFIGLGAIAKQIASRFKSDKYMQALVTKPEMTTGPEDKIRSTRSIRFFGNTRKRFVINGAKEEAIGGGGGGSDRVLEFNLRLPAAAPNEMPVFPREKSSLPFIQGEEFPRINKADVMTLKRLDDENLMECEKSNADEAEATSDNEIIITRKSDSQ